MKRRLVILFLAVLTVLTGCKRRDLEYGSVNLNLRLNLHLNVRVNGEFEELEMPEMMRVMFFDTETYELITESYLPATACSSSGACPCNHYFYVIHLSIF